MNEGLTEKEAEDKCVCKGEERKTGSTDKKKKCFSVEEEYEIEREEETGSVDWHGK